MNLYDYIKNDHKTVAELFEKFMSENDAEEQLETFIDIATELTLHAKSEERTFYKALEPHTKSHAGAEHAEDEHQKMKEKIAELLNLQRPNNAWKEQVLELKKIVEHHVKEEEENIFPKAKEVLSANEADRILKDMQTIKEELNQKIAAQATGS